MKLIQGTPWVEWWDIWKSRISMKFWGKKLMQDSESDRNSEQKKDRRKKKKKTHVISILPWIKIFCPIDCCLEKLHFTILNYTTYYILHSKIFKYTFCTSNYELCYTSHLDVKFSVNLDENSNFRVQNVIRSIV